MYIKGKYANKEYDQNWTIFIAVLCYDFDGSTTASDQKIIKMQLISIPLKLASLQTPFVTHI